MGADWWIHDAVVDSTAAECQRISLMAGELRSETTRAMAGVTRTPENIQIIQGLMNRAKSLDEQLARWVESAPESLQFRTLCWQSHNVAVPGGDYSQAEVFPGRVDVYSDFWVAAVWNQARTTRLVLNSIIVRCAAWVCSPVDYRTTPEYATAVRVCVETISEILASIPYHLGWHTKRRELFAEDDINSFACGDEYGMKGLAGYLLTWPLACVMTQDYTTDARKCKPLQCCPCRTSPDANDCISRTSVHQGQTQTHWRQAWDQIRTHPLSGKTQPSCCYKLSR